MSVHLDYGKIFDKIPTETKISLAYPKKNQFEDLKSQLQKGRMDFYPSLTVVEQYLSSLNTPGGGDKFPHIWKDFMYSEQAYLVDPIKGADESASKHGYTWENEFASPAGGVDYCFMNVKNKPTGTQVVAFRFGTVYSNLLLVWIVLIKSKDSLGVSKILSPFNASGTLKESSKNILPSLKTSQ
jgi:hypothetical protein